MTLEDAGSLSEGDAVRFTATGGQKVTAAEPAEILLWEMHATITGCSSTAPGGWMRHVSHEDVRSAAERSNVAELLVDVRARIRLIGWVGGG